jgi:rhamnosyl/mannosyltransferase
MKVLQLGKFYPVKGGVEKVMFDLVEGLSRSGIPCDMLCASDDDNTRQQVTLNPCGTIFVEPSLAEIAKTKISLALVKKLRQIRSAYDIIHIHHPDPMAALALYLSNYKGKVVLHWHSDILSQKFILRFYGPLQNWLIKRADLILGTSPVYVAESPYLTGLQSKINVLPIGITDRSKAVNERLLATFSQSYAGKKVIFSLGRLVPYKGFEYLVRAAAHLDESYMVLIGGKGPLESHLNNIIAQNGLQEKVKLLGYVSDEEVLAYFKLCSLFCLSSIMKTEAFAIVQIEAMSFSKPIVSVNIPGSGVSWVNENGVTGINVPIEDPGQIASAIQSILNNNTSGVAYASNSRRRYEALFTRDKMIDHCLELYKSVLK